jgi:hypothetical protein
VTSLRDPSAAADLAALAAEAQARTDRDVALRELLRTHVHGVAMRAATDGGEDAVVVLEDLAAAVAEHIPEGTENRLGPRERVLTTLLRRGAVEPARMLALDNASGVLRPSKPVSAWAGASTLSSRLPLPTLAEGGHVYAWLPGFRDPRWDLPEEVYRIDADVVARGALEQATVAAGHLTLYGTAWLSHLTASPDDEIVVLFDGPDGAAHRARAGRTRRPELVKPRGPELTRLAWGGWHARVPLEPLAAVPGTWRTRIRIEEQGIHRAGALGLRRRGPLAGPEPATQHERAGRALCLGSDDDGSLTVTVSELRPAARLLPRRVLARH